MKRIFYVLSCWCLFSASMLNAQEDNYLKDTYWRSILPGSNQAENGVIYFSSDTIFIAEDLSADFRTFQEYRLIGNTIYVKAIKDFLCDPATEGIYTVQVEERLMRFELVEDSCLIRSRDAPDFFYEFIGLEPPRTDTDSIETPELVSFHPIPSPDGIFYYENIGRERAQYIVYNRQGEEVKKGIIYSKGQVNLFHLERGIYFLTIFSELGWQTYRIVW